jgi:ABC-2 type transport system permease protein
MPAVPAVVPTIALSVSGETGVDRGAGTAQIFERGYRRYDGERLGRGASVRAVWAHAFQRILGMRRPVWAKILPVLVVFISYVPAIVFVGIVAFVKDDPNVTNSLPRYADYYSHVMLAVLLFASFGAPDVLCPDRRTGMLGIYLASPLTRDTYLVGKALAVFSGLVLVTTGPQLLLLIANSLQGNGVGAGSSTVLMVLRIIGAGFVVSALFTSLWVALSSLTDRKGFATAGIILVLLASGVIASTLADSHPAFSLLGLANNLPTALTTRIFGVQSTEDTYGVSTGLIWAVGAAWILVASLVVRFRYKVLQVTR